MPIAVVCPSCDSRLNAPEAAAGKTVKCPKCKAPMVIPTPEADPGFEAVDDPAPAPKLAAVKTDVMLDDDEEVEEKPRARKPARDVEDDEDRPKKKGKGKHKKKAAAGMSPGLLIGAIAGCVLLIGGGLFVMYWFGIREKPKETTSNSTSTPPGGPPISGGQDITPPVQPSGPVKPLYESSNAVSRAQSNNNLKQIGLAIYQGGVFKPLREV